MSNEKNGHNGRSGKRGPITGGAGAGLTLGSLFAGIGGFDLGFERAGWRTAWQVEINARNRAVLNDRFPDAELFEDVRYCGKRNLPWVDCITAGFPCQDISISGSSSGKENRKGLGGGRSGLFHEAVRIIGEIQPAWVVLENVPALLHSNDCADFEVVINCLAERGYLGFWRVLNARYFGVPQNRRRIFLVAGLGRYPSLEFLADAAPVEPIPCAFGEGAELRSADEWAGHTLQACNSGSRISMGSEVLVAEADGWGAMVGRERVSEIHGIPAGLDEGHLQAKFGAGNSVCPAVAEWIGRILAES